VLPAGDDPYRLAVGRRAVVQGFGPQPCGDLLVRLLDQDGFGGLGDAPVPVRVDDLDVGGHPAAGAAVLTVALAVLYSRVDEYGDRLR
jgi:hypothetical protein